MNTSTMKSVVLSEKSQSLTTEVIGSERQVEGKWKLLGDSYQADGVKSSMLDKTGKKTDANPNATLQFQITQAIIKDFLSNLAPPITREPVRRKNL